MTTLLSLSLAVLLGLFMSRLAKLCKLPAVTAYLITGILIGPFCLGHLGIEGIGFQSLAQVEGLDLFSNVALGFIAFAIGNEFRLSSLQQTGKQHRNCAGACGNGACRRGAHRRMLCLLR